MGITNVPELFGSLVFNDDVMKARLPQKVYDEIHNCVDQKQPLSLDVADTVASAMKDWAIEKGATHFTHWFQPMTGLTAEKHDSFLCPVDSCNVVMDFSGKELIRSEPDASSFPNGGIRSTFEARGYTAWDPTSYAFIKDNTLCIPSIFCSYGGEVLDKKTPLLRSIQAVDKQAMKIINLLGNESGAKHVVPSVGGEQEYFLVDRDLYNKREDLKLCGRTLFGAKPSRGQEMEDHYFGTIKPTVKKFMSDLDVELWKLGIFAKTEHNEVAPAQHELAPVYTEVNAAVDQNQLMMETMKSVAIHNNLACLIHEKPFAGVNGSGKHNNWSLTTDTGINLFKPGKDPMHNPLFLLSLAAVVKGVDEYQDLLRVCVASPGNDLRLGGDEAPPAILSIFLGNEFANLEDALENEHEFIKNERKVMKSGVKVIPRFNKDDSDRNRTSPFAYTGGKFEFRMVGSSASLAGPNTILNAIMAEEFSEFAERLERVENVEQEVYAIAHDAFVEHNRIIFNGNSYSQEWKEEAARRGLTNLPTCADAFPAYLDDKNVALFEHHKIYTRAELESRYEISMENYCQTLHIEAATMNNMAKKAIYPAVVRYTTELAQNIQVKQSIGANLPMASETKLLRDLSCLSDSLLQQTRALADVLEKADSIQGTQEKADFYKDTVLTSMNQLRETADQLELLTAKDRWPLPTYTDLLYSVV